MDGRMGRNSRKHCGILCQRFYRFLCQAVDFLRRGTRICDPNAAATVRHVRHTKETQYFHQATSLAT